MNKEAAEEWVKDLRSKKYRQGQCKLKSEVEGLVGYCCLGVLVETYNRVTGSKINPMDRYYLSDKYFEDVTNWSGIQSGDGMFIGEPPYLSLAMMNDELEYSFDQIATEIEKGYEKL